jgi:hypothetical protein
MTLRLDAVLGRGSQSLGETEEPPLVAWHPPHPRCRSTAILDQQTERN